MNGEIGAQVAPSISIHQPLPIRLHDASILAKKRGFPWQSTNFNANPNSNWNPNSWEWDTLNFTAKPALNNVLQSNVQSSSQNPQQNLEKDGVVLSLKLGVDCSPVVQEQVVRPSKRVRAGSPGSGNAVNYPMCQVDDCKADLSNAKDYQRRHKVCETHSKATKALVAKQMQRFCQQCSRFQPLPEFDEGKRSCRRRLAGHNKRRRKTQPEDAKLTTGTKEVFPNASNDLVNLLAILAKLQGNNADKPINSSSLPTKDQLVQVLTKINSLQKNMPPKEMGFDLNISQQEPPEQSCKTNENQPPESVPDLLNILTSFSQNSSYISGDDKTKLQSIETTGDANSHSKTTHSSPSNGNGRPPLAKRTAPFKLFGSSGDDSPPNLASSVIYVSSESSNPMEDRSPSCSPPMQKKLFPLNSSSKQVWEYNNGTNEASIGQGWVAPHDFFKDAERRIENTGIHSVTHQGGYASSSVSDHSPSSSNSDAQDRTGRIIFKLFDKDPSKIPQALRTQILNWLAQSPSEMESYIRPGCVVLSVYASMPSASWDDLDEDIIRRIGLLVDNSDSEFWSNGRFLVRTSRQLASHKDGKIRLCKSWKHWNAPEITSISPLAIVSGHKTPLILKGRNLTIPGTKIYCTYMGGYTSKEVLGSAYPGTIYDDSSSESFDFHGGLANSFGRCFIEVENGFKGNNFPVIIANSTVCQELRSLERELEGEFRTKDIISEDHSQDISQPRSREDLLHFLNELGWLFQRKSNSNPRLIDFSTTRFKYLLSFSVERDWSCLIKTILDLLVERSSNGDYLAQESLEMLTELHLLNRAVKRRCKRMVELLIDYHVTRDSSTIYLFPPNSLGPGGLTPLHLAASISDSEALVDALTNDPQKIGIDCWNSISDETGMTPHMYASQRNYHSYNKLVSRKFADKKNSQVSINVDETSEDGSSKALEISCKKCALIENMRGRRMVRSRGLLERPYVHSMLAIAAVCVCVCLFFRGSPDIGSVAPFKWENLEFGPY